MVNGETAAERLVATALGELGLPGAPSELTGRWKRKDETEWVAALVRKRTPMSNRWVADRLGMGHEMGGDAGGGAGYGSPPKLAGRLNALEKWVGKL